eukprot:3567327-Rhodomonas_salina.3
MASTTARARSRPHCTARGSSAICCSRRSKDATAAEAAQHSSAADKDHQASTSVEPRRGRWEALRRWDARAGRRARMGGMEGRKSCQRRESGVTAWRAERVRRRSPWRCCHGTKEPEMLCEGGGGGG